MDRFPRNEGDGRREEVAVAAITGPLLRTGVVDPAIEGLPACWSVRLHRLARVSIARGSATADLVTLLGRRSRRFGAGGGKGADGAVAHPCVDRQDG